MQVVGERLKEVGVDRGYILAWSRLLISRWWVVHAARFSLVRGCTGRMLRTCHKGWLLCCCLLTITICRGRLRYCWCLPMCDWSFDISCVSRARVRS